MTGKSMLSTLAVLVGGGTALAEPNHGPRGRAGAVQVRLVEAAAGDRGRAVEGRASRRSRIPTSGIVLSGFTDPIGTAPYNVGLAIRRARAIEDALVALGVPPTRS